MGLKKYFMHVTATGSVILNEVFFVERNIGENEQTTKFTEKQQLWTVQKFFSPTNVVLISCVIFNKKEIQEAKPVRDRF